MRHSHPSKIFHNNSSTTFGVLSVSHNGKIKKKILDLHPNPPKKKFIEVRRQQFSVISLTVRQGDKHPWHLPWQVHERRTVYRQLSAQPPHRLLPLKKNLNHFCLDCHSVCDNVYRSLTMFSDLAAVCTVDCAIEIVLITLHYKDFVLITTSNSEIEAFVDR